MKELSKKFQHYCHQLPVLGFNSAKYDLNLVKSKLAYHLNLAEDDCFVIKQNSAYTCISTSQFKFLDIMNFLAPGCSYDKFLKAYQTESEKGFFCYEYFDSMEKLEETSLPPYEAFYSELKGAYVCSREEYEKLQEIWREKEMKNLQDFLVWYNNLDTAPAIEAIEKMMTFYRQMRVDLFKNAVSVPGVARNLIFKHCDEKFSCIQEKDEDLYRTIKANIIGGPSLIMTRHHKVDETLIRGEKLCKNIVGYDANGLYLWAIGQQMPANFYVRRHAPLFKPESQIKFLNMFLWMDELARRNDVTILHKLNNNGKEHRIGQYFCDGWDPVNQTVYEYNGCYYHPHDNCEFSIKSNKILETRRKHTEEKMKYLQDAGYKVVTIQECEFYRDIRPSLPQHNKYLPNFKNGSLKEDEILTLVKNEKMFGMVECDIEVPNHLKDHFSEMCPLFCTTEVHFEDVGRHMQDHIISENFSREPRRLLIAGLKAEKLLIATPLLKWYLEHGLKVTKIHQTVEYTPVKCFSSFVEKVSECILFNV